MIQTSELIAVGIFVTGVCIVYLTAFQILFQWFYRKIKPPNKFQYSIVILAFIGILCILYGYFIEPIRITTTYLNLKSNKIPPDETIRLAHISDLHIEKEGRQELIVPELIKKEKPDFIVLTGDYLNSDKAQPILKRFLEKLQAPYGVYAVMGNFDDYSTQVEFGKTNVKILLDETASLNIRGSKISLSDGRLFSSEYTPDEYRIALYHTPDIIPEASLLGFDLYLCGHTHGGQVRLPFYGALMTLSRYGKRYEMGYYKEDNMDVYVNRGIGLEPGFLLGARFLCPPEITIITITGK